MERDRVTVQEAASRLGISESGVRKRVQRGQIDSSREEDGRVFVYLDSGETGADSVPDPVPDRYVERLEDEIAYLREESRRKDEIIMQQAVTMRALTAGPGEAETVETEEEPPESTEGSETTAQRPWWRFWG